MWRPVISRLSASVVYNITASDNRRITLLHKQSSRMKNPARNLNNLPVEVCGVRSLVSACQYKRHRSIPLCQDVNSIFDWVVLLPNQQKVTRHQFNSVLIG